MRRSLVFVVVAAAVALTTTVAYAGDLYGLQMKVCLPAPGSFPVEITIDVHKGELPGNLKGSTSATFDGTDLSDIVCDDLMCITDAEVGGDMLYIYYDSFGYKDGEYERESYFDVFVGAYNVGLPIHTSCSTPIYVDHPYGGAPLGAGTFYVVAADGDCLDSRGGCPPSPLNLQWVYAKFEVPCMTAADLVVNLYKNADMLKGTSGGYFDGMDVTGIYYSGGLTGAGVALDDAEMVGDTMVVYFYAYGTKSLGQFPGESRFELIVDGCGTFYMDIHTSCSQDIYIEQAYELMPEGEFMFLNGCASCLGYVPVEDRTWGTIKSLYR